MPEVRVDLEVLCTCGADLSVSNEWAGRIFIEPCEKCLQNQYDVGFTEAMKEAENG